jgi:hypothetical protein
MGADNTFINSEFLENERVRLYIDSLEKTKQGMKSDVMAYKEWENKNKFGYGVAQKNKPTFINIELYLSEISRLESVIKSLNSRLSGA